MCPPPDDSRPDDASPTDQGPQAGPDVSVRVAWGDDAAALAGCQRAVWLEAYAGLMPADVLEALDAEQMAAAWADALARPGDARNRVLVALERASVRGYAVLAPSSDPDSDPVADVEVVEAAVGPAHRRQGHGSRLLQAVADTAAADRFTRATWWVRADDDALRAYLQGAGWAPDGAHRELDLDGSGAVRLKQVRLHTALSDASGG